MRAATGGCHPGREQRQREQEADEAEVGERLHDEAVRVLDFQQRRAVAQARRLVAAGSRAERRMRFEHVERLAPVARAHAGHRRQASGRIGRRFGVRVRQRADGVRHAAREAAVAHGERSGEGEHGQRDERHERDAGTLAQTARGRLPGGHEPDSHADDRQQHDHRREQRAELMAGGRALGERDRFGAQRMGGEVPRDDRARAEPAGDQHRGAAQAKRHDAEPQHEPEHERDERAARVCEQQRDEQQAHRRIGERAEQHVSAAARRQPHAADRADRGGQAGRVPVAVGRAQSRVHVVDVQLVGEHLRRQRVAAHDHRRQRDAADHRGPARGSDARERRGRREHAAVGEQAPGFAEAFIGLDRPHDRERRERREGQQQRHGPDAVERPRGGLHALVGREQRRGRDDQPGAERERHLGDRDRRGFGVQPTFGIERDRADDARDEQRRPPQRSRPRRPAPALAEVVARAARERRGRALRRRALSGRCVRGHGSGCSRPERPAGIRA